MDLLLSPSQLFADPLPLGFWYPAIFVLGAIIGSFLNVCIYRLPLEKSILWPYTSHCMTCWQPIQWYDNIPLISYWVLWGRCRKCGARYPMRVFLIELFTALGLVGLFYLEVVANVHEFDAKVLGPGRFVATRLVTFAFHGILCCFLLVATFSDLDHQIIPLPLTITGTIIGLIGAVLLPWPWPYAPSQGLPGVGANVGISWANQLFINPRQGIYPWPVWGPLPAWLQRGGNWQTGLLTGLAGALIGSFIMRAVRFLFGFGMGPAYMDEPEPEFDLQPGLAGRWFSWVSRVGGRALGLGDADLMMMAGSFLGWQPVMISFLVGVFAGLLFGIFYAIVMRSRTLPFGPGLAAGVVITMLGWSRIGPHFQPLFFDRTLMGLMAVVCFVMMPLAGYCIRMLHLFRH